MPEPSFLRYPLLTLSGSTITPASILVGLVVLAISIVFAWAAGRSLRALLARRGLSSGVQFAIDKIVRYFVATIGFLVAFNSMGLKLDALIAASTVLAVGIGFGLQNVAQNFISGLVLLLEQPVRKGDFVKVGDTLGVIDDIGMRATFIVTRDEVTIIVPNSVLVNEKVVNHSRPTNKLRVRVTVGVSQEADNALVKKVLLDVARDAANVLDDPPAEVRFEEFADNGNTFALLFWISNPNDDHRISSEIRFAIDSAFRENDVSMGAPQRDVRVRGLESLKRAS